MRINLILLFAFIFLSSKAEELLLSSPKKGYMTIMKDFMAGFFKHFDLPFPLEVLNCFTERGTIAFFDFLEVSYQLGHDVLEGDSQSYRILVDSFTMLNGELTPFLLCQWQTDEWKTLLHHTIPDYKIPENDAVYLNYISKFYQLHSEGQLVELAISLENTQKALLTGNYSKAGDEYALVFSKSHAFLNESMIEYLKFEAFDTGFTIAMGFSYEDSSIFCYNNQNVETAIEWYYHLSQAITGADMDNVTNATTEFFEVTGPELRVHIPQEIGVCLEKMPGTKRFSEKFAVDSQHPIFPYALIHFAKRKPESYYNQMTSIWTNFDDWDFLNAGLEFGDMIKQILEMYDKRVR